ncbi:spr1630 family ClpXP-sensitive toxin [Pontibacillus salipaludis]|uniref:Uncharacterized protein n=1 Tax=Pontibacillus salipaludis TaxID=1697394 RepID=A0ABQ1PS34_9BACI|nr:hypothetical protein [Pontibacillus salipaludis]GGD02289.1 hypothetical protein GCM10011389_07150 [Pontibacillus salipaludis]
MKKYKFENDFAQGIVDGILQGYKDYLGVRKEKKIELEISSAYAWVKGNHIEDAVSQKVPEFGVTYNHSKAGYAWGYLQFTQEDEKVLFIIKHGMKHGTKIPSTKKRNVETNYLAKLSRINSDATFNEIEDDKEFNEQLTFDDFPLIDEELNEEVTEISRQHDRFFIISYTTDNNKMISEIELLLPNPNENVLYRVESWTELIENSNVSIDATELDVVSGEKEPISPNQSVADYGIEDIPEEQENE